MAEELDVKGLTCPLPVLRVKKRMRDLAAGAEEGGVFVIGIRRGA